MSEQQHRAVDVYRFDDAARPRPHYHPVNEEELSAIIEQVAGTGMWELMRADIPAEGATIHTPEGRYMVRPRESMLDE